MSSKSRSAEAKEGIAVGRILRAHGIRGELKVEAWSDVADRFSVGRDLRVEPAAASGLSPVRRRITGCRPDRGILLIRLDGVDDRDAAEALRGAVLTVDEADVPDAPEGFYYHYQLVGCRLEDHRAGDLGEVVEVIEDGGGHLLRVEKREPGQNSTAQKSRGLTVLIPFVDAFLRRVDIAARQIEVELPEGLIESCTSKR